MSQPSKVLAKVTEIQQYQSGVYGVSFETPVRANRYLAGQFLHLTLDEFDPTTGYWPESRVFSIASQPRQGHVSIVYSVKGVYTRRMEQELAVGKDVWLKYPYGDFVIHESSFEGRPLVLLAGGTGVAPYIPYLTAKELAVEGPPVHLYYGARLPELFLFCDELLESKKNHPRIALRFYHEEGNFSDAPA
ncbi:MAG: FAD-dependent oxidoreductase, partial [Spirochaetales bacterium]|nr:FAD-dependent oxidoreductase [Spirochaetales bacterium]